MQATSKDNTEARWLKPKRKHISRRRRAADAETEKEWQQQVREDLGLRVR